MRVPTTRLKIRTSMQPGFATVRQLHRQPALPLEFNGQRMGLRRDVPAEGVDADEVLAGMGLDESQIASLREQGIVR